MAMLVSCTKLFIGVPTQQRFNCHDNLIVDIALSNTCQKFYMRTRNRLVRMCIYVLYQHSNIHTERNNSKAFDEPDFAVVLPLD